MMTEIRALQQLHDLLPGHVPSVLGIYQNPRQPNSVGFFVEWVHGPVIADSYGIVRYRIPLETVDEFIIAVSALADEKIYVDSESVRTTHFDVRTYKTPWA